MSRYTGPKLRLVRKLGTLPGLTSKTPKKQSRPGQHGAAQKKKSDYGVALEEKQKIRFNYGLGERQLQRYMNMAKRSKKLAWDALLGLCEMRLDNIVFRLGFAPTIPAARQLIRHGHVLVNDKRVDIPSFQCSAGHKVSLKSKQSIVELVQKNLEKFQASALPEHLTMATDTFTGNVLAECAADNVLLKVNARLVVEYYNT